jgi:uncharacterized membrane protein (UPF0127 family)
MKLTKVKIKELNYCLGDKIEVAGFFSYRRIMGLMGKKILRNSEGLLLLFTQSIHTFFMLIPIDVVFISNDGKIIKIFRNLKPWRMTRVYLEAKSVLELPAGKIPATCVENMMLEFEDV